MKDRIHQLLLQTVATLQRDNVIAADLEPVFNIERTRDPVHGDWATNLAMTLAKVIKRSPREVASLVVAAIPVSGVIEKIEIAGPGFINFFLRAGSENTVVTTVLSEGVNYGRCNAGAGQKIQVEFVSANPTGPLHVGHGRGAAYGATYANLLAAAGFSVEREYYVNDAGRQMDILATSTWLRYLQEQGGIFEFPSNGYKGEYIHSYAQELVSMHGTAFVHNVQEVFSGVIADEPQGGDKEKHIDGLITNCKKLLGKKGYQIVFNLGLSRILDDIRVDLADFGVHYEHWFSERSLTEPEDVVARAITRLQENGYIEEREGALWFMSTRFGDDKDRVVKRENGQTTYFASDIAYHLNKFERGFDRVINIWGADHHGYIVRVKAALQALGIDPERLVVRLVQFVSLYRGEQLVQMSTRSGSFVTLRELRDEVGNDAARFFYVTRRAEQAMDFDLDLARSQSKDNPVYYVQYAHARVCSVERKGMELGMAWNRDQGLANLQLLVETHEKDIIGQLARYPEVVKNAAIEGEPHLLANYLRELAGNFHAWYNAHKTLVDDAVLRDARLALSFAVKQVIFNGLALLGVSAPEQM